jgi:ATP diphosphatase
VSRGRSSRPRSATASSTDLPAALPALHRAFRLQDRAAGVGFDWPDATGPLEKVDEELGEVRREIEAAPERDTTHAPVYDDAHEAMESELGDLLFAVVNLCRKLGVHPALALDKANVKFARRFKAIEGLAAERAIDVRTAGLQTLDRLWDEVKRDER